MMNPMTRASFTFSLFPLTTANPPAPGGEVRSHPATRHKSCGRDRRRETANRLRPAGCVRSGTACPSGRLPFAAGRALGLAIPCALLLAGDGRLGSGGLVAGPADLTRAE